MTSPRGQWRSVGAAALARGFPGAAGADKSGLLPADPAFAQPLQKGIWSGLARGHSVEPWICRAPAAPGRGHQPATFPPRGHSRVPGQDIRAEICPESTKTEHGFGNVGFSALLRGWNRSGFSRRDIPRRRWWRKGGSLPPISCAHGSSVVDIGIYAGTGIQREFQRWFDWV